MFVYFFPNRKSASVYPCFSSLDALVALCPGKFTNQTSSSNSNTADEDNSNTSLPLTSYPCQWKPPRKRKESNLMMVEANFEKHVYGKPRKNELLPLETFNPRPTELRGKSNQLLKEFIGKVKENHLEYLYCLILICIIGNLKIMINLKFLIR